MDDNRKQAAWIYAQGWLPQAAIESGLLHNLNSDSGDLCESLARMGLLAPEQAAAARRALEVATAQAQDHMVTPRLPSADVTGDHAPPRIPRGADFGAYALIEEMGRGGGGSVYRARHRILGTEVALKTIGVLASFDAVETERFRREAAAIAKLKHPNIVRVTDFGDEEGLMFYAMELVAGTDLKRLTDESLEKTRSGPSPERAARWFGELASALEACHGQGLIHRDIKPQNVMVEDVSQRAVLVDFGLVKRDRRPDQSPSRGLTGTGEVVGTPAFMSPEQIRAGSGPTEVTAAADVWSLGATLFYALSGQTPYASTNPVKLFELVGREPPRDLRSLCPEAPPWLTELVMSCLRERPEERPSPRALRRAVREALAPASRVVAGIVALRRPSPLWLAPLVAAAAIAVGAWLGQRSEDRLELVEEGFAGPALKLADGSWVVGGPRVELTLRCRPASAVLVIADQPHRAGEDGVIRAPLTIDEESEKLELTLLAGAERRSWTLELRGDFAAPLLHFEDGFRGLVVGGEARRIRGRVADASPVTLSLDGAQLPISDGRFDFELPGGEGREYSLEARDALGQVTRSRLLRALELSDRALLEDLQVWSLAERSRQMRAAERVAARVKDLRLTGLRAFQAGGRSFSIAVFRDEALELDLHLIPGGTYTMGTVDGEAEAEALSAPQIALLQKTEKLADQPEIEERLMLVNGFIRSLVRTTVASESPAHRVRLGPFFMASTELSRRQWSLGQARSTLKPSRSAFSGSGGRAPQICGGREAVEAGLKSLAARGYRLSSEAEWEYACRAGTETRYFWGDLAPEGRPQGPRKPYAAVDAPGPINAFGLAHMLDNAPELCADDYRPDYADGPTDARPRRAASGARLPVARGGNPDRHPREWRCAARFSPSQDAEEVKARQLAQWWGKVGLRLVRDLPPERRD